MIAKYRCPSCKELHERSLALKLRDGGDMVDGGDDVKCKCGITWRVSFVMIRVQQHGQKQSI